ncbi:MULTISPECIES: S8 family serine peptidase [unclassified Streptomyces]|uniref:S8 family serine peptidase n=1 Tax=unclassified Streptomyces TaxID=2593676 RepID=UPI0036E1F4D2
MRNGQARPPRGHVRSTARKCRSCAGSCGDIAAYAHSAVAVVVGKPRPTRSSVGPQQSRAGAWPFTPGGSGSLRDGASGESGRGAGPTGRGGGIAVNDDVSAGIRFAVDNGAKVINVSLGNNVGSQRLTDAVKYALGKGSLVFAAAGNSADKGNTIEYPAGTPGVVGVGAVGKDLKRATSSQHGPQVDLAAPGVDMVHACTGGTQLCKSSGTSDATAIASASAALIWSKHPDWTNSQVLRAMLHTAGGPFSGDERTDYICYGIVLPASP